MDNLLNSIGYHPDGDRAAEKICPFEILDHGVIQFEHTPDCDYWHIGSGQ